MIKWLSNLIKKRSNDKDMAVEIERAILDERERVLTEKMEQHLEEVRRALIEKETINVQGL